MPKIAERLERSNAMRIMFTYLYLKYKYIRVFLAASFVCINTQLNAMNWQQFLLLVCKGLYEYKYAICICFNFVFSRWYNISKEPIYL